MPMVFHSTVFGLFFIDFKKYVYICSMMSSTYRSRRIVDTRIDGLGKRCLLEKAGNLPNLMENQICNTYTRQIKSDQYNVDWHKLRVGCLLFVIDRLSSGKFWRSLCESDYGGWLCKRLFPATRQYNRNIVALEWIFSSFVSIHIGKLMAGGGVRVGKSMRFHGISDWHQVIWPHESASSGNSISRKALSWYHGEHHRIRAPIYCLPAHSPQFQFLYGIYIVSHICPTSLLYAKA